MVTHISVTYNISIKKSQYCLPSYFTQLLHWVESMFCNFSNWKNSCYSQTYKRLCCAIFELQIFCQPLCNLQATFAVTMKPFIGTLVLYLHIYHCPYPFSFAEADTVVIVLLGWPKHTPNFSWLYNILHIFKYLYRALGKTNIICGIQYVTFKVL